MKAHNKTIKFFTHAGLMLCMMLFLSSLAFASYERSEDRSYDIAYYDSARISSIPSTFTGSATNVTAGFTTLCSMTVTTTYQPLIYDFSTSTKYILLQDASTVYIYDTDCVNVADLSISTNAPVTLYNTGSQDIALISQTNGTLYKYNVSPAGFVLDNQYVIGNITNSYGICTDVNEDGVDYCFFQDTSNNLVRLNLLTDTVTTFEMINSTISDTSIKAPAIRSVITTDHVYVTGLYNNTVIKVALFNTVSELVDSTTVKSLATNQDSLRVMPPFLYDMDGGSTNELIVGYGYRTYTGGVGGLYTHYAGLKAYSSVSLTPKFTAFEESVGTYYTSASFSISNVFHTQNTTADQFACIFGEGYYAETLAEEQMICIGNNRNLISASVGLTASNSCYNKNYNAIRADMDFEVSGFELLMCGKYWGMDVTTGTLTLTDKGDLGLAHGLAVGDIDGDSSLDMVKAVGSTVSLLVSEFSNEYPEFIDNPISVAGSNPFCVDESYQISTDIFYFTDADDDQARILVDCYGDFSVNATTDLQQRGYALDVTYCEWNETGNYDMRIFIQDEHMIYTGELGENITLPISVSDDVDTCNAPYTTSTTISGASTTSTTTPSQSFSSLMSGFGLSGAWLTVVWLIIMAGVTIGLVSIGMRNPYVIGMMNLFLLIMGNIFGAVSVWVTVLIGLVLGVIGAITIFAGRGG